MTRWAENGRRKEAIASSNQHMFALYDPAHSMTLPPRVQIPNIGPFCDPYPLNAQELSEKHLVRWNDALRSRRCPPDRHRSRRNGVESLHGCLRQRLAIGDTRDPAGSIALVQFTLAARPSAGPGRFVNAKAVVRYISARVAKSKAPSITIQGVNPK